jgi:2-polyprenyl-3-methyl-5-hydroxy-6-metoxy-1,4-benzoquinol methylase
MRYTMAPCPACGSAHGTQVADADELRAEVEALWSFHTQRVLPATPPRMLHDRASFSQRAPLRIARCDDCSLLFRNPREHTDELDETYAEEEPDGAALRTLYDVQRRAYRVQAARLAGLAGGSGRGLEVGSYVGAFLAAARERGWAFTGVDVNARTNAFACALGFDVLTGSVEDASDDEYDVVAFWNCFDQLADPGAAARAARERLPAGGLLAVRVPNGDCYRRWRARLHGPAAPLARAVLAHNNLLAFPYRHGFTVAALRRLLATAGFTIERVYGDPLVPTADRWTRRWARAEERVVKVALRALPTAHMPWLEVYARAV